MVMKCSTPCLASSSKTKQVVHYTNHTVLTINNDSILHGQEMFNDIPVCVTKVSDSLTTANPESYWPTKFGLGPHHHGRPNLHQVEIYKASEAIKYFDQHFRAERTFSGLVEEIRQLSPKIRACYSSRLKMEDPALARIMATDGLFLCKWLEAIGSSEIDDVFLRDVIMLENQVPILILKKILDVQFFSYAGDNNGDDAECRLHKMLWVCCRVLYPFVRPLRVPSWPADRISNHGHLLGLLYSSILAMDEEAVEEEKQTRRKSKSFMETFDEFVNTMLPNSASATPKIKVPSASRLHRHGVKLVAGEGIRGIRFNPGTASLHLPPVKLDPNTAVAIRNLVAYEQYLIESRQLKRNPDPIFSTYVELMEGLASSEEDVRLLREQKIVVAEDSVEDRTVAKLLGSRVGAFGKRSRPIEKAITEASEYCDGFWKARSRKCCKKLAHVLWSLFKLLFFFSLSGVFCVSIFCSVVGCSRNQSNNNHHHPPPPQQRQVGLPYSARFRAYT